jgi:hypothetical protein
MIELSLARTIIKALAEIPVKKKRHRIDVTFERLALQPTCLDVSYKS